LRWLLLDLKLNLLPLLALLAGLAISLWANPWVLFASGASGHVAVRFLEVASFVVGGLLGSQILGPEVRARAVEVVGSRSFGLGGLLLSRFLATGGAWMVASLWLGAVLIWSDVALGPYLLALAFVVSGITGMAFAAAVLTGTGSQVLAMVATSLVTGVFLIASVAEIQLGPWHLFPLYAYYARPAMMTAKLAWALISAGLLAYALMKAVRPAPLLQRMD